MPPESTQPQSPSLLSNPETSSNFSAQPQFQSQPSQPKTSMPPLQTPPPRKKKDYVFRFFVILLILLLIFLGVYLYFLKNKPSVPAIVTSSDSTSLPDSNSSDSSSSNSNSNLPDSSSANSNSSYSNSNLPDSNSSGSNLPNSNSSDSSAPDSSYKDIIDVSAIPSSPPAFVANIVNDIVDSSGAVRYYVLRFYEKITKVSPLVAVAPSSVVSTGGNLGVKLSDANGVKGDITIPVSETNSDSSDVLATKDDLYAGNLCFRYDFDESGYVASTCDSQSDVTVDGTNLKTVSHKKIVQGK